MADRVKIDAEVRTVTGKKVKTLRAQNIVPGVIYGQQAPVNVQMDQRLLRRALRIVSTSELADLQVAGEAQARTVLVRDIQQHVTRGDVLHVDFFEVDMKSTLTAVAELVLVGKIAAELSSIGVVTQTLRSVEIETLPGNLVSEIEVDISLIKSTGDVITVADLKAPEGVEILSDPDTAVARFETASAEESDEAVADEEGEAAEGAEGEG